MALLRESGLIALVEPLRLTKSTKDRDFYFSVFYLNILYR